MAYTAVIGCEPTSKKRRRPDDREIKPSDPLRIAIIGGGLGGLACALALQQQSNLPSIVTVYERDDNFSIRKQGYGLTLTNNEKGPLAELGLLQRCIDQDCASNWHWVFDRAGKILGYYGRAFSSVFNAKSNCEQSGVRGNLRIPRQDLRQMLLDELKDGTIQWGRTVKDYTEQEDCIHIDFMDGTSISADVVVGADGIRSAVRQLRDEKLYGGTSDLSRIHAFSPPLRYIGTSVILGLSTTRHPLIDRGGFYMYDGEHRLFTMPFRVKGDVCLTMWQLSFRGLTEEAAGILRGQSGEILKQNALDRTVGCFDPVQQLITDTPTEEIWATGLYDRDPMPLRPKESRTRVTIIGDAAHPMSMFKGQGANQAISDGPRLAKWLCKRGKCGKPSPKELETRLRCFEREMLQAAGPKVLASRAAASSLHTTDSLNTEYGFSGCKNSDAVKEALLVLQNSSIGADKGSLLEDEVLKELTMNPSSPWCVAAL